MFDKTNNPPSNLPQGDPDMPNRMDFDQQRDFKIEDFPVHTMKKDLENINNPAYFSNTDAEVSMRPVISEINARTSEAQLPTSKNTSPFLGGPQNKKISENTSSTEISKEHPGIGWAIIFAIVAFVVLIAVGGGYYFWMTLRMGGEPIEEPPIEEPIPEPPITPDPPIIPPVTFSKNTPNYLGFDIENSDFQSTKAALADYANKVVESGSLGAYEFIITDKNNNPVFFQDFSQKFGLTLPENIQSNLGSEFSFFIYNYGSKTRYGLEIALTNEEQIKKSLAAEEKMLPQYLMPIFGSQAPSSLPEIIFNDTSYKGVQIRYINISIPEDLALDYAIYNKKLVIATTKSFMYAVLDYMQTPLLVE